IPRPPNAFLCFRSQLIREQKARSGQHKMQARDISRRAGHLWKEMSEEERRPYLEMSLRIKEEHMVAHPDYKFAP
ncbi:high mobility group box domain-containing protein, partial [Mycena rosella]